MTMFGMPIFMSCSLEAFKVKIRKGNQTDRGCHCDEKNGQLILKDSFDLEHKIADLQHESGKGAA